VARLPALVPNTVSAGRVPSPKPAIISPPWKRRTGQPSVKRRQIHHRAGHQPPSGAQADGPEAMEMVQAPIDRARRAARPTVRLRRRRAGSPPPYKPRAISTSAAIHRVTGCRSPASGASCRPQPIMPGDQPQPDIDGRRGRVGLEPACLCAAHHRGAAESRGTAFMGADRRGDPAAHGQTMQAGGESCDQAGQKVQLDPPPSKGRNIKAWVCQRVACLGESLRFQRAPENRRKALQHMLIERWISNDPCDFRR
jgi:hypothetical protein